MFFLAALQLGHRYPPPGAAEAVIDVGLYEERQLTSADKDTFPLVIRLETVNDKGRAEAHSLQVWACSGVRSSAPGDAHQRLCRARCSNGYGQGPVLGLWYPSAAHGGQQEKARVQIGWVQLSCFQGVEHNLGSWWIRSSS